MSSPHERPARFDVGIVGAGRVGAVLGAALTRAGHHVTGVSAVSEASLDRAATLLPGVPVKPVPDVVSGGNNGRNQEGQGLDHRRRGELHV